MISNLYVDEQHQSVEKLVYTIPGDDPKATLAVEDHIVDYGGKRYYIDEIVKSREGTPSDITVTANILWMRLAGPKKVGSFVLTAVDAPTGLEAILEGTTWIRGTSIETASVGASGLQTLEAQDSSVLDLIWKWAKLFQLEVTFDTIAKTVDFVEQVGVDRGYSFRYGRNLSTVKRTARVPEATRVYPYGRDNLNISSVTGGGVEYIEDYSFYTDQGYTLAEAQENRRDLVWSDNDVMTAEALLRVGQAKLAKTSQPYVKYECSVIDLSALTGINEMDIAPGDTVRVKDDILNFDFVTRVARVKRYDLEPWKNEVELATLDDNGPGSGGTSGRSSNTRNWNLYKHDSTEYRFRNDGTYLVHRIALTFVEGEAVFGYDVTFTGVGTGSLSISAMNYAAIDTGDDTPASAIEYNTELVHPVIEIPYEDGVVYHEAVTWAMQELAEQYDFRIRMIATASSASTAFGLDIAEEASRFWILARGATQNAPTLPNTERFDFVLPAGAVQQFTVPDNVNEVVIECVGAAGSTAETSGGSPRGVGGGGCRIIHTRAVLPGQVFDVYCPGGLYPAGRGGGGDGDSTAVGNSGGNGGGATSVVAAGGSFADSIVVAAGGGGGGFYYSGSNSGGDGGFYVGDGAERADGAGLGVGGEGATMFTGGLPGAGGGYGTPGSYGQGGAAGDTTNSFAGPGGGGGGGWYGGGGASVALLSGAGGEAGGGGGGSSYLADGGWDFTFEDGYNTETTGYVIFSWDTPEV